MFSARLGFRPIKHGYTTGGLQLVEIAHTVRLPRERVAAPIEVDGSLITRPTARTAQKFQVVQAVLEEGRSSLPRPITEGVTGFLSSAAFARISSRVHGPPSGLAARGRCLVPALSTAQLARARGTAPPAGVHLG